MWNPMEAQQDLRDHQSFTPSTVLIIMILAMWETSQRQGASKASNFPYKMILLTRPLLWDMAGYLLSEQWEYMET